MLALAERRKMLGLGSELPYRWFLAGIDFTPMFIAGLALLLSLFQRERAG